MEGTCPAPACTYAFSAPGLRALWLPRSQLTAGHGGERMSDADAPSADGQRSLQPAPLASSHADCQQGLGLATSPSHSARLCWTSSFRTKASLKEVNVSKTRDSGSWPPRAAAIERLRACASHRWCTRQPDRVPRSGSLRRPAGPVCLLRRELSWSASRPLQHTHVGGVSLQEPTG